MIVLMNDPAWIFENYHGCMNFFVATTGWSMDDLDLDFHLGANLRGTIPRGKFCPPQDCYHVTDAHSLRDATCDAIAHGSSVVNVCASTAPIWWSDNNPFAYNMGDNHVGDVLGYCDQHNGHDNHIIPHVKGLKYQCIGGDVGSLNGFVHGRVLHPHDEVEGQFTSINYLADVAAPACAIDFFKPGNDHVATKPAPPAYPGTKPVHDVGSGGGSGIPPKGLKAILTYLLEWPYSTVKDPEYRK